MLPEIGATELMVIAAVALIVVGPKDLPMLLRKLGSFVARLRGMASEFRSSFDEMARQSELEDLRREVAAMRDATAAEGASLQSSIDGLNNTIHSDGLTAPANLETAIYDPESYLNYDAPPPPETPAPKARASKVKTAKPGASKAKAAPGAKAKPASAKATPKAPAAKKAAPKTTISKVATPSKSPTPHAPRKAAT